MSSNDRFKSIIAEIEGWENDKICSICSTVLVNKAPTNEKEIIGPIIKWKFCPKCKTFLIAR